MFSVHKFLFEAGLDNMILNGYHDMLPEAGSGRISKEGLLLLTSSAATKSRMRGDVQPDRASLPCCHAHARGLALRWWMTCPDHKTSRIQSDIEAAHCWWSIDVACLDLTFFFAADRYRLGRQSVKNMIFPSIHDPLNDIADDQQGFSSTLNNIADD
jgi:hypothetical protein